MKFDLPIGSKKVAVQAQVMLNVAGSKQWDDGEGAPFVSDLNMAEPGGEPLVQV